MSDASSNEHLASVSYLPWAVPGERPGAVAGRDDADALGELEASAPRDARHPVLRRGDTAGSRPRRGLALVEGAERDPRNDSEPETGAERDARIDRLVVSRLRRSSLSIAEVRDVLVEHGLDDVEVDEWIERYERLGYLDDARLAEQLVHVQATRRGRGSGAILSELTRRGLDPAVARAAVDELDPDAERAQAFEVAERRARQLRGLEPATAHRRLSAFLQRRGYPSDVVRDAVAKVLPAERS
ncbi:RecX family transcriptional regulator [Agromyces intestinalis]|uniref:Regulatory protein RecX n=1 Tax=Agromyces intestinalis TaxID=2592652 RepID=A0A5C1YE65_9MICO|nr:regulatory protein RecX [Agromyces intestinalis]QEO13297.1 RecX family transcriptional regulator [Agromyces intestinalis]